MKIVRYGRLHSVMYLDVNPNSQKWHQMIWMSISEENWNTDLENERVKVYHYM